MAVTDRMRDLVVATGNAGKLREFRGLLEPHGFRVLAPKDIGFAGEVDEVGETFRDNALLKARALAEVGGKPTLADDSGLEVRALGGAPGLHTARYAGPGARDADNRGKLLAELRGAADRSARFVCVLCYLEPGGSPRFFEADCPGRIAERETGAGGFGYDCLFLPDGYHRTFAELPEAEKDGLSHRGRAVRRFLEAMAGAG